MCEKRHVVELLLWNQERFNGRADNELTFAVVDNGNELNGEPLKGNNSVPIIWLPQIVNVKH